MIVIIGVGKLWTVLVSLERCDRVEVRMHGGRVIMIRSRVNVLERRYKERQH